MRQDRKMLTVMALLCAAFLALALSFHFNLWGRQAPISEIPLVDTNFLSTATARVSAAELFATPGADTSDYDCYVCHEKGKAPTIRYDNKGQILVPTEHKDIVLGHGAHGRNNNCFNCHNETNLLTLQTRDGRELKITDSPSLCGSCHGPTFRDWEVGVHGRTGGYWDTKLGEMTFKPCTACHDPHHPKFPGRKPAPGPHPLHPPKENTKLQTSNFSKTSRFKQNNLNPCSRRREEADFPAASSASVHLLTSAATTDLKFEAWTFSGAWSLEFGA